MDNSSALSGKLKNIEFQNENDLPDPFSQTVRSLSNDFQKLWWRSERSFPQFNSVFNRQQQKRNEADLSLWIDQLNHALDHIPKSEQERNSWEEQIRSRLYEFVLVTFPFNQKHLDYIENSGMIEASLSFIRMARQFDPLISGEDIYQAGRNVMTCNFIQILLDLPVEVTPSIFAYSMLYPCSDNYLDDPAVPLSIKYSFNQRFQKRLQGETVELKNQNEETISRLVSMIENQWSRAEYPQVYQSLLAIHTAQARSLRLNQPNTGPYETDVLGISFEKGGTSVLADGYLVAGSITPGQARYMFGYGTYTQLMDDLEDVSVDIGSNRQTIFSQTAPFRPLDNLTNQVINYGRLILGDLDVFDSEEKRTLAEIINRAIDPIMIDIIGRVRGNYSKQYLAAMEKHASYRFRALDKLRRNLARRQLSFDRLAEVIQKQT